MTDKKNPSESKQDELYTNHTEPFPQPKDGGALTMLLLVIWYAVVGIAGIALLGFVALFVACMV